MTRTLKDAVNAHRADQLDLAAELYSKALTAEPDNVDATHLLGVVRYQQGKYTDAVGWIRKAIAKAPHRAEFHLNLGNVLRAQGLTAQAKNSYQTAYKLNPKYHEALYNHALLCKEEGEFSSSEILLKEALALSSGFTPALISLGDIYFKSGRYDSALQQYSLAAASDPKREEVWLKLAKTESLCEKTVSALRSYDRALALNPDSTDAHASKGKLLVDLGLFQNGVVHLSKAHKLANSRADIATNLAVAEEQLGENESAYAHYKLALDLIPNSSDIRFNYGYFLLKQGAHLEAKEHLERACNNSPPSMRKVLALGLAYEFSNDHHAAKEAFAVVIGHSAKSRHDQWMQSLALMKQGRLKEAFDQCSDPLSLPFDEHDSVFGVPEAATSLLQPLVFNIREHKASKGTVLVSGNRAYITEFLPAVASSLRTSSPSINLHVHVMLNPNEKLNPVIFDTNPVSSVSFETYSPTSVAGYTTRRFIRLFEILSKLQQAILLVDIDSRFIKDVRDIFDAYLHDVTIYERKTELYMNQYIAAGMLLCRPSPGGLHFARAVSHYLCHLESKFGSLSWFSDQMALLAAKSWVSRACTDISLSAFDPRLMTWYETSQSYIISYKGQRKHNVRSK